MSSQPSPARSHIQLGESTLSHTGTRQLPGHCKEWHMHRRKRNKKSQDRQCCHREGSSRANSQRGRQLPAEVFHHPAQEAKLFSHHSRRKQQWLLQCTWLCSSMSPNHPRGAGSDREPPTATTALQLWCHHRHGKNMFQLCRKSRAVLQQPTSGICHFSSAGISTSELSVKSTLEALLKVKELAAARECPRIHCSQSAEGHSQKEPGLDMGGQGPRARSGAVTTLHHSINSRKHWGSNRAK